MDKCVGDAHQDGVSLSCVGSCSALLLVEQPAFAEDVGLAHDAQVVTRALFEVHLAFHYQEEVARLVPFLEDNIVCPLLAQFRVECD